jgi:hemoglobin
VLAVDHAQEMCEMDMAYGTGATSYEAAGGQEGVSQLVDAFYRVMDSASRARVVRAMHEPDLTMSREKLKVFLSAWLGGPNEYRRRFGPISLPGVHAHLDIGTAEQDAWLYCMQCSVDEQPWRSDFKAYFMRAIAVPAARVRVVCERRTPGGPVREPTARHEPPENDPRAH